MLLQYNENHPLWVQSDIFILMLFNYDKFEQKFNLALVNEIFQNGNFEFEINILSEDQRYYWFCHLINEWATCNTMNFDEMICDIFFEHSETF